MRKIKEIVVGGITGTGERIGYQVDVFGETNATDEIFNGAGMTPASQQPNRGDAAPTAGWPDSTFNYISSISIKRFGNFFLFLVHFSELPKRSGTTVRCHCFPSLPKSAVGTSGIHHHDGWSAGIRSMGTG